MIAIGAILIGIAAAAGVVLAGGDRGERKQPVPIPVRVEPDPRRR